MDGERPRIVVMVSTSVDARVSLGARRIWTDDFGDPRSAREADPEAGAAAWR